MSYSTVVDADTLAKHLDDPSWVVVDCRFTLTDPHAGRLAYEAAHIPGAVYAHLDEDLSARPSTTTGRHPLPDAAILADKLGQLGIDNNMQVVVYDDTFGGMAGRLWWLMRWLGHDAVALLNGGLPAWKRAGHPMQHEMPTVAPATFVAHVRHEFVVTADELSAALEAGAKLIDARMPERFAGIVEPLDRVAGHIPGAINWPFEDNLDLDGTFMSSEALLAEYRDTLGVSDAREVIMMCGSGVTACHNLVAMEIAGLAGARLYVGSWSDWITDSARPVATGL